ncbi:hypothetical protein DERF_014371 [Dermatophagoides farinae]|uniref:Uncharacterized protein n=1 Tax=Dermatophagoides farinae TaxID=6954 RepID=A0A922L179_DERFA|nr:hypothetical protein DERF_014371 [Dermatophagoides farinae]
MIVDKYKGGHNSSSDIGPQFQLISVGAEKREQCSKSISLKVESTEFQQQQQQQQCCICLTARKPSE